MAAYRVVVKTSAAQELDEVEPKKQRVRLAAAIGRLADEPRPPGSEKLAGTEDAFRIRSGDYRVVFTVDDTARVVRIVKIGHRREVYR